ncbi:hypothetical protein HK102_002229 [Quaeritorhiza haematococci]|nr:hypothetical protein HK102_002229 [Quaeritorhiza haematococci]
METSVEFGYQCLRADTFRRNLPNSIKASMKLDDKTFYGAAVNHGYPHKANAPGILPRIVGPPTGPEDDPDTRFEGLCMIIKIGVDLSSFDSWDAFALVLLQGKLDRPRWDLEVQEVLSLLTPVQRAKVEKRFGNVLLLIM